MSRAVATPEAIARPARAALRGGLGRVGIGGYMPGRRGLQACRVCGCTNGQACVTAWRQPKQGRPAKDLVIRSGQVVPAETCTWVERDLCSRCAPHAPLLAAPTRRQLQEVARIESRHGPCNVLPLFDGMLVVEWTNRVDARCGLTLDRDGRPVAATKPRRT